jgi:hypothetical protein
MKGRSVASSRKMNSECCMRRVSVTARIWRDRNCEAARIWSSWVWMKKMSPEFAMFIKNKLIYRFLILAVDTFYCHVSLIY